MLVPSSRPPTTAKKNTMSFDPRSRVMVPLAVDVALTQGAESKYQLVLLGAPMEKMVQKPRGVRFSLLQTDTRMWPP